MPSRHQNAPMALVNQTAMSWRVIATARHFDLTPGPSKSLMDHGFELLSTAKTGSLVDSELEGEGLIAALEGVDAIIAGATKLTSQIIERANSLKVISRRGVGFDNVDVNAASGRGIVVTVTPGTTDSAVGDHVFALMLAAARGIVGSHRDMIEGRWIARVGVDVWKKTLGIVGLGRIGKGVALRARGFQMRVLAYDPYPDEDFARENDVRYVRLEELLRESDFISVNASLTDRNRHLIGERELLLMKQSAIIVNASRGGLVDEAALTKALAAGRIRGAGIDTFEVEPPGQLALASIEGVVLTPHVAGYTEDGLVRSNEMAVENIIRVYDGHPPAGNVVNPEVWDKVKWKNKALG